MTDMNHLKLPEGGLKRKIFNMAILIVVSAIVCFAILGVILLGAVLRLADETGQNQIAAIKDSSQQSMMSFTEERLKQIVLLSADRCNGEFWTMRHDFNALAEQVEDVFANSDKYREVPVALPDKNNGGKYALQLMSANEEALKDADAMRMAEKLANLAPLMEKIISDNSDSVMDCLIALPNGLTLMMDVMSDRKFSKDGALRTYDPRTREWYKGALEKGSIYFTEAVHSYFYDLSEVAFGVPVYVDGKPVAVLEGAIRLDSLQKFVSEVEYADDGFSVLISRDGQIVYSPRTSGELAMDHMLSGDIRDTENEELKKLVDQALSSKVGFTELSMDGEEFYASYAPVETVDWTQIMFVSKSTLEKPTESLLEKIDEVNSDTLGGYEKSFVRSCVVTLIIMLFLILCAGLAALSISGRIINPINVMTENVRRISGDNLDFKMEDIYRTGDEIEVLAKAFTELSEKTEGYIEKLVDVTAEKERFQTEIDVAKRIQADMIPGNFPLFPDRSEFDLYGVLVPAAEVSGDCYDVFMIDDDHLCLVMVDVAGKGVPASMFMAIVRYCIQGRSRLALSLPSDILKDINNLLCDHYQAEMAATAWVGILTVSTGEFRCVSAGHEEPVLISPRGDCRFVGMEHGSVLALKPGAEYTDTAFTMEKGSSLFIYTDGVTMAKNINGEPYGKERMLSLLSTCHGADPEALIERVLSDVNEFTKEVMKDDDLTMMTITINGQR